MDRKMISHRIRDILGNLSRLSSSLHAMDSLDIQRYPDNYETISTEAALRAEKTACQLRSLLYASTGINREEYLVKAADTHGIDIRFEDGVFAITLPRLLPKKKGRQSGLFLLDPLGAALSHYAGEHPLPRFRECVVCICHVYDHGLPECFLPDYDNLQQKQLLDMIALYVMADDSCLLCDAYNTTEYGDHACTRICIMKKDRFTDWLQGRENSLKNISDF